MPCWRLRFRHSEVAGSVISDDSLRCGRRISVILLLLAALGCGSSTPEQEEDYLIRLGELKITRHDFLQAFELVKTAYPGCVDSDSPELQQARRQLLNEMTIELILVKRSQELGVTVSKTELDAAVAAVKADYPPGIFEQTLIESALPFEAWKQRLRNRLLMDKLVDVELRPHVAITAEDLTGYYEQNYGGKAAGADSEQKFERLKGILVADLQRAKTEEAFGAWIDGLRSKYIVEVNAPLWARIAEPSPTAALPQAEGAHPGK
jgi:hypothetical protein